MTGDLDPDDAAWTGQCVRVDDFWCDTVFRVSTGVQFCDETGRIIPGEGALLPAPRLPLTGVDGVTAADLVGRERELVPYYRDVVAAFASRGRVAQLRRRAAYFWLRPAIIANGSIVTDCPYYDTVPEAEALLQALVGGAGAADGEMWDDLDQGWQMRIVKSDGLICLAEWDWEERRLPVGGQAFDPVRLSREAGAALARLRGVHRVLVEALGYDWWS